MFFPPPRRERGFARAIFMTLATTIFGLSLVLNLYFFALAGGGLFGGSGSTESTLREGSADQRIAVLPIEGIIDAQAANQVSEWLRKIEKDSSVKGLVLAVDTPGGGVTASDEIHHRIAQLKAKRGIPVAVSMGSMATSGGYYVSCGTDRIFAQPTTLTGNIGVLLPRFNASELVKKLGVQETTITEPKDGYKNAGSMFQPESEKDTQYFQGLIGAAYGRFTDLIEQGRKGKLKGTKSEMFNGQVFTAKQALDFGLVDQIGYPDDAFEWIKQQANLSKPTIVKYERRLSLMDVFSSKSSLSAPAGVNVNLSVDPKTLDELSTPRLMYLWRGQ